MIFEEYSTILNDVIELAKERRMYDEKYGLKSGSLVELMEFEETEEGKKLKQYDKDLDEYLQGLDFEAIKIIQTIMYLGRDNDYPNLCPEQRYKRIREEFDKSGWKSKSIEISQIAEKLPLDKYLKAGIDILNQ